MSYKKFAINRLCDICERFTVENNIETMSFWQVIILNKME